jgi:predicted amidohydrolase
VRVFAMNPKLDIAWMESRDTYRAKMFALADRTMRGGGAPLTQSGADDMASHLRGPDSRDDPVETARDLVVWPEDVGLFAALTGSRGAPARASGSLEGSILTLASIYGPQNGHYAAKFPAAADRPLPVRLTLLSLTDTFGRVAVETFSEMAKRYGVWLEAGVNMAQDWQVVCTDREAFNSASPPRLPSGQLCQEENAQKVQQLGDPFEPDRDYVYEAVTGKVSNMALLFDPAGRIRGRVPKQYITPVEMPGVGLDLVAGDYGDPLHVATPVGTLGFVTSKDAWMPDVQARLDQARVDLLVQPEFFVNDLVKPEGMWAPDTYLGSGYNDALRLPSVETVVAPQLSGNIFNFSADAQGFFALKPRTTSARSGRLVGQPDAPGLIATPWVVPDPVGSESFPERRKRLGEAGLALAPGSGVQCRDPAKPGPCENGHVESVLWRDVEVARRPKLRRYSGPLKPTRFSAARPVAPSKSAQRGATVARHGRRVVMAYEERGHVKVVRSADGGRSWSKPSTPGAGASSPAIAIEPGGAVTVAWVASGLGGRVVAAHSPDGGRTFATASLLGSPEPGSPAQWKPALGAGRGGVVHAAFVYQRERSADDGLPQAHLYYLRLRKGRPIEAARRLDTGDPSELAAKFDHSWAPRIAVRGERVLVTWLDFLRYDWDVFARVSDDGGTTFGEQRDVNDTPAADEALNDTPDAALGGSKQLVAWTDWRKRESTGPQPHPQYDVYLAEPGGPNRQVDPYGKRQLSTFFPSICATKADDALVAFQDSSRGQADVQAVFIGGGAATGAVRRVDDAGDRGGNAWRPRLACWGDDVLAAWEDERDGPPQIYAARSRISRLR